MPNTTLIDNKYVKLTDVKATHTYTITFTFNGKCNFRVTVLDTDLDETLAVVVPDLAGVRTSYKFTVKAPCDGVLVLHVRTPIANSPTAWTEITNVSSEASPSRYLSMRYSNPAAFLINMKPP